MNPHRHAICRGNTHRQQRSFAHPKLALYSAIFALLLAAALPLAAQDQKDSQHSDNDKDGIGFNLGQNASAKDVGLPIYPGSRRHQDNPDDNSALNMGLWGGSSGFKLFVLKMETTDAPDKVAAFYRKALAKYGQVLDCSNPQTSGSNAADDDKKKSSKSPYLRRRKTQARRNFPQIWQQSQRTRSRHPAEWRRHPLSIGLRRNPRHQRLVL